LGLGGGSLTGKVHKQRKIRKIRPGIVRTLNGGKDVLTWCSFGEKNHARWPSDEEEIRGTKSSQTAKKGRDGLFS